MKFYHLILALLALNLVACKSKKAVEEHPPGMDSLRPIKKNELPDHLIGDWEKCEAEGNKSVYIKVNLSNSLEIKKTIYNDPYCQKINSTRESTVITFYHFEYENGALEAKVQSRKLVIYSKTDIEYMNKEIMCGLSNWEAKKPKEILGTSCLNLPRDNKYDLSIFTVSLAGKNLLLNGMEFNPFESVRETEPPQQIVNFTNSRVTAEPGDRNVRLVYPPAAEKLIVKVTKDSHPLLRDCPKVLGNYQTSVNTRTRIKRLQDDVTKEKDRLAEIQVEINNAITDLVNFIETNNLQEYDRLSKEYEELDEIISTLQTEYKYCEVNCPETFSKLQEQRKKRTEINSAMIAQNVPRRTANNYYAHINEITRIEKKSEQQKQFISTKEKVVKETEATLNDMFTEFDRETGVPATINFTGSWSKNLDTLVKANPGIKFRLAPLSNLIMTYKFAGISNYPSHTSIVTFPNIQSSALVKGRVKLKSYPETMNGTGSVSLLAACPARNPQDYKLTLKKPGELEYDVFFESRD